MNTYARTAFLGLVTLCLAASNGSLEVSKKEWNRVSIKDGQTRMFGTSYRRGGQAVLSETTWVRPDGTNRVRVYTAPGTCNVTEFDTNGDGVWDRLMLDGPDGTIIEAFERNTEGAITPVSAKRLLEIRSTDKDYERFFGGSAEPRK